MHFALAYINLQFIPLSLFHAELTSASYLVTHSDYYPLLEDDIKNQDLDFWAMLSEYSTITCRLDHSCSLSFCFVVFVMGKYQYIYIGRGRIAPG